MAQIRQPSFWIAARYLESLTLCFAPLIVSRNLRMPRTIFFYLMLFAILIVTIFSWPIFPSCYTENQGLTPFRKVGEYVIATILLFGFYTM